MYSVISTKKMFKIRNFMKDCSRSKVTFAHKSKEGSVICKNYICSTNLYTRRTALPALYTHNVILQSNHHGNRSYYDVKIREPKNYSLIKNPRNFHTSTVILGSDPKKASSKVEETTEAIKEKTKEITEKKPAVGVGAKVETAVAKKPLRQRILDEIYHYYHGFRLLFIDIRVSSSLVWKVLKGGTLTRREYNLLIRTVGDMFRLVPFSIFIIVPFMEFLLPVFIKFFPGMLPSTFQTATAKDDKMKQSLKVKMEMAKFLQQTLDEMAVTGKGHSSKSAKDFIEFFQKVRNEGGGLASNEEILKFSKLFEDEITLDSLTRSQLMALCRVLELQPFGTTNLLRFQLRMKLRSLAADDVRIKDEGVESLTQTELQSACRARGMRALGMSEDRLRAQLTQWLDLSLNEKVPPSLLLLSRAFMLPETITTTEKLVATISALPDTVATKAKAAIGEREGKVDNKTKIELIKEEVAKIKEEKKEEEESTVIAPPEKDDEVLLDKAPILKDTATVLMDKPKDEKDLSTKDIGKTLEDVLDTVGKDKKKMIIEKEELDDLKEEMKDYQEDVQNLSEAAVLAKASDTGMDVKESKAAKRLSRTVNKMIKKMDVALLELEKKELEKKETMQQEQIAQSDELLKVDELIAAIHKMKEVPDSLILESIIKVLGKIDSDKDGVVKVEDLLKVIEMIGRENIKLSENQIDEIMELMKKEEEAEDKLAKENLMPSKVEGNVDKKADSGKEVNGGKNSSTETEKSNSISNKATSKLNLKATSDINSNLYTLPIPPSSTTGVKSHKPSPSVVQKNASEPSNKS